MLELALEYLIRRKLKFKEYYDLSAVSSIKAGGVARLFAEPKSKAELCTLLVFLAKEGIQYRVVGGLTNTLVATDLYTKVVVSTKGAMSLSRIEGDFTADAGASLASLMSYASRCGYGGVEQLWLIPGTVGAALVGNSGAHGVEMSDVVLGAEVLMEGESSPTYIGAKDLCLSYRDSVFKRKSGMTVLSVTLRLDPRDRSDSIARRRAFLELRHSTQPANLPSLGSVFKRASGIGAGYYVERAGLKGLRIGGAEVSQKHAGFIVNVGGAGWRDVNELVSTVRLLVKERLGVELEPEIQILN